LGARYCSVDCQKKDWLEHKAQCKIAQEIIKKSGLPAPSGTADGAVDTRVENVKIMAQLGNVRAMHVFGTHFQLGLGVPRDVVQACYWWRKAAEKGCVSSQAKLGGVYICGCKEVPADLVEAWKWLMLAANSGDADSQAWIGSAYFTGQGGVTKDTEEGIRWWKLGAAQGHGPCQDYLNRIQYDESGEAVMEDNVSHEDQVNNFKLQKRAADQGIPEAMLFISNALRDGQGVSVNLAKSLYWLKRAANLGHLKAQFNLGFALFTGCRSDVPCDKKEGIIWLKKSAEEGLPWAIDFLDKHVPKDTC
jgi:TPR repeat protein